MNFWAGIAIGAVSVLVIGVVVVIIVVVRFINDVMKHL